MTSSVMSRLFYLAVFVVVAGCSTPWTVIRTTPTGVVASRPPPQGRGETHFTSFQTYKGWPDSWLISNGHVWAAVVPSLGRLMQFGCVNEEGVFWENPALLGHPMKGSRWDIPGSFGGDKTWPAPQSAWDWPPPDIFDQEPLAARSVPGGVVLESGISPRFGIRTERRIELVLGQPVMRVTTTYHKVQGDPVEVGVWVITQVKNPVAMYLPIPTNSLFAAGYSRQWGSPTNFLSRQGDQLRFTRDPKESHKIGNDANLIVWQGTRHRLTIESPRIPGATYPDGGCSMEIYTNGGAADYVELETLGPLKRMSVGDSATAVNVYRLSPR